jgi:hypothetical protein
MIPRFLAPFVGRRGFGAVVASMAAPPAPVYYVPIIWILRRHAAAEGAACRPGISSIAEADF